MSLIIALSFALITAWYLTRPHFTRVTSVAPKMNKNLEAAYEQRERCLQVLKDLELDHQTSKITDSDYQQMKVALSQELAGIFQTIDGINKPTS